MTRRKLAAAGATIALLAATPTQAQFGGIVFDPRAYVQHLLVASRTLQQINNQIQSLQNEATMLRNMARNLSRLDVSSLTAITSDLKRIDSLMGQAQNLGYQVAQTDRLFRQHFATPDAAQSAAQITADAKTRWQDAMDSFHQTMQVQSSIVESVRADSAELSKLLAASEGAEGSLQAQQASNQLTALAIKQQMQLQSMMAAQFRAEALEKARAAADQEAARAAWTRFVGTGDAYTPR
ncbi:P-type conjugative transfer protein TrbJ [Sphingomonas sp. SORGH_AS 950]|uniref:P-type conjugative transfer protein TrbJ n=1 Tax=Sphingomonas sp. SORGH_AS_0950 TaxID=3041792 RepID=UPI00277DC153|nr:P-type conjugative transfer protein TrbJ [Sphingomonas sp. SORGH_AS_0950]MDQ1158947.1 P-type conjugative transfer protein TrbJ [Sphingomonas sp. SORGH_AS_0950]